ncbi:MAG TPA: alpha-L-fucosidase [Acidimicrobiia bacterium]|nr:alpha-L-fucosidase [Acidimicrobiia bacterium]
MPARVLPQWFDDAKLGVFVHWTPASVPAFAPVGPDPFTVAARDGWERAMRENPYVEWYQNSLAIDGSPVQWHHRATYGDTGYDAFVREFVAAQDCWHADAWAQLFAAAGARYVVLVTKHHDGFLQWPSATLPLREGWHARRDVVGELARAVRERGMRFGVYYSGGLDWTFGGLPITDLASMLRAIPQSDDYVRYVDAHWRELIARVEPSVLWADIGSPAGLDLAALFAHYYGRVPDGVVNNRFDMLGVAAGTVHADFVTPEYSTSSDATGPKWETTRGMGTSFGFNREETDDDYLSPRALVHLVVEVVAAGGNLLLNVGPNADGTVVWDQATRLVALGHWLHANGEAIYDTVPSGLPGTTNRAGDAVRFTHGRAGDVTYAIVLDPSPRRDVHLPGVDGTDVVEVTRVDARCPLHHSAVDDGVVVTLPAAAEPTPALAFRLALARAR